MSTQGFSDSIFKTSETMSAACAVQGIRLPQSWWSVAVTVGYFAFVGLGCFSPSAVQADNRVALVIGNNQYQNLPASMQLTSPKYDAEDVAAALQRLGYTLVNDGPVIDASRDAINTATEKFALAARDAVAAVFYFSGHGIQVGEDNYLLPSDTPKLTGLSTLNNRAILLRNSIMVALEEAGAETKVIILDCCRDNPFSAQLDTALAQVGKSIKTKSVGEITGYGPGFYLAFATSPGQSAADGNGARNSPFTAAMLEALPGGAVKDIDFYFRDVKAKLPRDQVSWTNHSLNDSFSLAPGDASAETMQGAVGKSIQMKLPGKLMMKFSFCPAGSFMMGSPKSEAERDDDEGQILVRFSQGFWMGQTEVTQGQWMALMGSNPSNFKGDDLPVEQVSWEAAQAFIIKLNQSVPLPHGWKYTLPTEAQWEYACRAGTETPFHFGSALSGTQANCDGNYPYGTSTKGPRLRKTSNVGIYAANAWGLYDMHGNVWEWCSDWYGDKLAGGTDPGGPASGSERVMRGGSGGHSAADCRAACRGIGEPSDYDNTLGFRAALVPSSMIGSTPLLRPATPAAVSADAFAGSYAGQSWENSRGSVFRWCPPGEFLMGSSEADQKALARDGAPTDYETQQKVRLSKGFWMSQNEVTQGEWDGIMGVRDTARKTLQDDTIYNIDGNESTLRAYFGVKRGDDPMSLVLIQSPSICMYWISWNEAVEYCRKLTDKERTTGKIPEGWRYALPTEAQWEYACRAGTDTTLYNGSLSILGMMDAPTLDEIAWYGGNSSQGYEGRGSDTSNWPDKQYPGGTAGPRRVGQKIANRWGLNDMIGNVSEWCADWFDADIAKGGTDPRGQLWGVYRVHRGGAWNSEASVCRAAERCGRFPPEYRAITLGFRPVLIPLIR